MISAPPLSQTSMQDSFSKNRRFLSLIQPRLSTEIIITFVYKHYQITLIYNSKIKMSSSHVGNGAKLFHLSLLLRRFKHHVAFCPVIRVHFEGSQLGAVYVAHHFAYLCALDQCLAALSRVFEDLVHLESFTVSLPVSRLLLLCVFQYYLFFVFLKLYGVSFGHACAVELGKTHVLLFIGKIRYSPLFFLLIPV